MIKFNRVFKIYGKDIKALTDVSFHIKTGEFVFLTGASGAGKSTILKLLYLEEHPDMGTIFVDDRELSHISGRKTPYYRRGIGFVFQDFKLLFDRTVFENIAMPMIITGANKGYIKETVFRSIEKVGLSGKENIKPWHLSGGEKQKVAIARSLILSPPILLADEPTGNLDHESSWEIMNIFEEINKKGTCVFVATHNREIISRMGHRVIKLSSGEMVQP